MGYSYGYGYGYDKQGWIKAPFFCDGIWLLTPTGPIIDCFYVWDDLVPAWNDNFYWTENI